MSKEAKKFAKKKARERRVKLQKLHKQAIAFEKNREMKRWEAEAEKATVSLKEIKKLETDVKKMSQEEIRKRLEDNLKILESLEQEYMKEQVAKEDLSAELGGLTSDEKVAHMKEKVEAATAELMEVATEAEVRAKKKRKRLKLAVPENS